MSNLQKGDGKLSECKTIYLLPRNNLAFFSALICNKGKVPWDKVLTRDTVPEIIDSEPMCITDLFQNKYLAYFNPEQNTFQN